MVHPGGAVQVQEAITFGAQGAARAAVHHRHGAAIVVVHAERAHLRLLALLAGGGVVQTAQTVTYHMDATRYNCSIKNVATNTIALSTAV